jgi:hypothetical protein
MTMEMSGLAVDINYLSMVKEFEVIILKNGRIVDVSMGMCATWILKKWWRLRSDTVSIGDWLNELKCVS